MPKGKRERGKTESYWGGGGGGGGGKGRRVYFSMKGNVLGKRSPSLAGEERSKVPCLREET